jgi:putative addiction module component (TIGR02574 family)
MTERSQKLLARALKLPPFERAELVEQIIASFDFPDQQVIDQRWAAEAEARLHAFDHGLMGSTPADAVFDAIERRSRCQAKFRNED